MDKLQYNILLEESGIYEKRKLGKDEAFDPDSDFIYKETANNDKYEIIPNELTTEEIKIVLLAKQAMKLNSINTSITCIAIILILFFLLILIAIL
jgi:hypothetical protein